MTSVIAAGLQCIFMLLIPSSRKIMSVNESYSLGEIMQCMKNDYSMNQEMRWWIIDC